MRIASRLALLVLTVTAAIAGCTSQPISTAEATHVPADRIVDAKYLQPAENTGKITVKRDRGYGRNLCSTRIFIDAKPIADIRATEKIEFYLPEGDYVIGMSANSICIGVSEVSAFVKQGAELNFRVSWGAAGDFSISRTAF